MHVRVDLRNDRVVDVEKQVKRLQGDVEIEDKVTQDVDNSEVSDMHPRPSNVQGTGVWTTSVSLLRQPVFTHMHRRSQSVM